MTTDTINKRSPSWRLARCGGLLCLIFAAVNLVWLYPTYFTLKPQPIFCVVLLYLIASGIWLWALRLAVQTKASVMGEGRLLSIIFWFAICCRAVQLCAPPILELDIYRYMWDGIVVSSGTSPYVYSPEQVLTRDVVIENEELRELSDLATKTQAHHAIVSQVHFAEYTTIYPPASQLVFAATMWCVPDTASPTTHLTAMKFVLVSFDLVTMLFVLYLIRMANLHVGWLVAYGWNPLVIKEIANSGHLDSIAVCFAVAAICFLLSGTKAGTADQRTLWRSEIGALLCLAIGTAAKLFPVILVPLFALVLVHRRGWWSGIRFCVFYGLLSAAMMSWMLMENDFIEPHVGSSHATAIANSQATANTQADAGTVSESKEGLGGFLKQWRMNDSVFTFVYENCKPDGPSEINRAWYVLTSNSWREKLNSRIEQAGWSESPPFLVARVVTSILFVAIYWVILIRLTKQLRASNQSTARATVLNGQILENAFLIVAVFFVLQPTQNPWYWVWALPLVCFAKNRGWLFASAFLFTYYLRFLFKFSDLEFHFAGAVYQKAAIFDHCFVWLEHLAIFAAIVVGTWYTPSRFPVLPFCGRRIEKSQ